MCKTPTHHFLRHRPLTNSWHTHTRREFVLIFPVGTSATDWMGKVNMWVQQTVREWHWKEIQQAASTFQLPAIFPLLKTVVVNYCIVFRLLSSKWCVCSCVYNTCKSILSLNLCNTLLIHYYCNSKGVGECFFQHVQYYVSTEVMFNSLQFNMLYWQECQVNNIAKASLIKFNTFSLALCPACCFL